MASISCVGFSSYGAPARRSDGEEVEPAELQAVGLDAVGERLVRELREAKEAPSSPSGATSRSGRSRRHWATMRSR